LIRQGILDLSATLKKRALEFKHTPIIGRTHGVHAEPTTFGLKLLLWYSEMQRNLTRFDAAAEDSASASSPARSAPSATLNQNTKKPSAKS